MRYISGIHALNLPCSLLTSGDWHRFGIQWDHPFVLDSDTSVFGNYGVEECSCIPRHPGKYKTANHIRAILDMLAQGQFSYAQGMKNDFICADQYTPEIFEKVLMLRDCRHWDEISKFMGKEYGLEWVEFLEEIGESVETSTVQECPNKDIEGFSVDYKAQKKCWAYARKERLRDLADLAFLCINHFEELSDTTCNLIRDTLSYKGIEQFDYLVQTQDDPLVDKDKLAEDFLKMHERLVLLTDSKPKALNQEFER